jgi:hypothetical protein
MFRARQIYLCSAAQASEPQGAADIAVRVP